ncbi:transposase for insertion sequence element IS1081 [Mycobacterium sp. 20KCMC460]|nr:transposase for insertion sequence element IS1081 [Mycobacterium sp. 20KCMC460]
MTAAHDIDLPALLAERLTTTHPDVLRELLATFIHTLMGAEADALCGAAYGQRSSERTNSRNGYRHRQFDTRAGSLDLAIPKLRQGSYFPDWLLERRKRAERALTTVVATCYLLGVSTRRMDKLVETLGITGLSKSQVSVMAKELDTAVEAFRTRPLDAGPYTFMAADALVLKVREAGRVVNVHALIAVGVNAEGYREILGIDVTTAEDGAGWLTFLRSLTARGLSGVALVTSDAHAGLLSAIGATLPGASWQRCRTHYATNLMAITPKSSWPWVKTLLHSVFDQPDATSVAAQYDRIIDALSDKLPKVADHLEAARSDLLAFTAFPKQIWRQIWSNNPQERLEQRNPPPHRCRRDLPRPRCSNPPRRRCAGRTTRRMGRVTALPGSRRPQQIPPDHHHTSRTGGQPRGTNRISHDIEESHDDVVHHVPGLDRDLSAYDTRN